MKIVKEGESSLQYYLLPSANPPRHLTAVHNQMYRFWKECWVSVLSELKAEPCDLESEFLRQDLIASIWAGQEVVAMHLYSFFALDAEVARNHRYLANNYPPEFFERLSKLGVRTVMSMEYLTVNPAWRKRQSNVHMGAVIGALGLEVMKNYGIDAVIAPARRDHKVHEMAYAQGGDCIVENVINHNVPCDLIAVRSVKVKPCPAPGVDEAKSELWANRIHLTATEAVEKPASALNSKSAA